jgi:hypothetical protein
MAMSMMLRRLGVPITVHGFRSSFREWAAELRCRSIWPKRALRTRSATTPSGRIFGPLW